MLVVLLVVQCFVFLPGPDFSELDVFELLNLLNKPLHLIAVLQVLHFGCCLLPVLSLYVTVVLSCF